MNALTPAEFLNREWFLRFQFGQQELIFGQPSSSILVFVLSLLAVLFGLRFLSDERKQKSQFWCGLALVISGVGSAVAGIYYQAFGYQIRCSGLAICASTSLWESLYLCLSSIGVMSFLFAIAYSSLLANKRKYLILYALTVTFTYNALLLFGIIKQNLFLLSYDFSILFTAFSIVILVVVNGVDYLKREEELSRTLLRSYFILFCTSCSYYLYYQLHLTEWFWARNMWFSQNDVLHLGMIVWIYYLGKKLAPLLHDRALGS